jgi:hypothetical protein
MMANKNVRFFTVDLKSKYDALVTKDSLALYWIEETKELYKGDILYGTGAEASEKAAGLLSSEDYIELKKLIAAAGKANLEPVDASVIMVDGKIGVQLSKIEGNGLELKADGLYAVKAEPIVIPEYALEKQAEPTIGSVATYKLKKTVGEEVTYVGDAIELGKEIMLQGGSLEVVTEDGKPYAEAKVGDKYLDLVLNDEASSHIYVPVNGLVDNVKGGRGVEVVDNTISIKLSPVENNALVIAEDGGLFVPKCDFTAVEKTILNSISDVYATKTEVDDAITRAIADNQIVWEEMGSVVGVAQIGDTYYATVQAALAAAQDGDTIKVNAGTYNMIEFTKATAPNISLIGDEGVYVGKVRLMETANYSAPDGLKLKNITFNGEGIVANDDTINNMSIVGCNFVDGAVIHVGSCITNGLTIENCEFEATNSTVNAKEKTAILVQGTSKNVIIRGNNIKDAEHNAIQVVGVNGSMLIDSNAINNTGSRAMRITTKDGAVLAIMNNVITNANTNPTEAEENSGEIIKITGTVVDGAMANNTYDGNNLVFNNGFAKVI